MRKRVPGLRWTVLLLLLSLGGCEGSESAVAPSAPLAAPLLILTDSQVKSAGNIQYQVEADQQGKQRWMRELPAPCDALAEASRVVYVGTSAAVLAFSAQTGQVRWSATASPQVRRITVLAGQVYVDTGGGFTGQEQLDVFSLDGRLLWQYTPPAVQDIPAWLVDGGVFYTVVSGFPALLVARDATTGLLLFSAPLQLDSPVQTVLAAGPEVLLVVTQDMLVVAARKDGATIWQRHDTQSVAPQVFDGTIYSFALDQPATPGGLFPVYLRALRMSDGRLLGQQPLKSADEGFLSSGMSLTVGAITKDAAYLVDSPDFTTLHAWRLSDGKERWTSQPDAGIEGLLADAQTVYLAAPQRLFALQASTGQVHWRTANPDNLTSLSEARDILVGMNPLTSTLAGYSLTSRQRLWKLSSLALDQYIVI